MGAPTAPAATAPVRQPGVRHALEVLSKPGEVFTFVVAGPGGGPQSFSKIVGAVLQRAHARITVDLAALRPALTPFLRLHGNSFRNSVAVVKLGEDIREWLQPDGQYIRSALATVHSLLLTWREQQRPWPGDPATAAILAETVVFPFHDNVIAAHDHQMDAGERLLFDAKKCRIIFGTSPINGERRFSMWYEMLAEQFAASPKCERLALEVSKRVADAEAQVCLAMEQEKIYKVSRMGAKRMLSMLRSCWTAWASSARGASASSRQSTAPPPESSRDELRRRLHRQVKERRRTMAH